VSFLTFIPPSYELVPRENQFGKLTFRWNEIAIVVATDLPVPKGLPKKTVIEETVVTGDSSSGVYWKIVS